MDRTRCGFFIIRGVAQVSVPGLTLFNIYIKDLEIQITSSISIFAVDGKALTMSNCDLMQKNLDQIIHRSEALQISFTINK